MKFLVALVLFAAVVTAVSPAEEGHTIMQPTKGGDAAKGETVLAPKPAEPASTKPMTPAKIDEPKKACAEDACKPKAPETVAPEIKEEPKKVEGCPCHTEGNMCQNTCSCCAQHVTPEIKEEKTNTCGCCHLDTCGCCAKKAETVVPEEKETHVAPEIKETPACPEATGCTANKETGVETTVKTE